jgi:hypothetical protein
MLDQKLGDAQVGGITVIPTGGDVCPAVLHENRA